MRRRPSSGKKLRVAFVHPDLGLGGAERLIVDMAQALVNHVSSHRSDKRRIVPPSRIIISPSSYMYIYFTLPFLLSLNPLSLRQGHHVEIYTAYHDPKRCFPETISGAFPVHVRGDMFPRSLFGRFYAACAYTRTTIASLALVRDSWSWATKQNENKNNKKKSSNPAAKPFDIVIADQVSCVVPFLKIFTRAKVLFYCHFPDLLLAQPRGFLHRLYRAPLNWLEQVTTGQADRILVNSNFTRHVFAETFRTLTRQGINPKVLYPCVDLQEHVPGCTPEDLVTLPARLLQLYHTGQCDIFVSINRFERKKGLPLLLRAVVEPPLAERQPVVVLAGGYDARVPENVQHLEELKSEATALGLAEGEQVFFLPSFSAAQRRALLTVCRGVVYTPQGEHFGIVPLEAMAAERPLISCNSGGPLESVVDGQTGYLVEPTPAAFADAMNKLASDPKKSAAMGLKGRKHVQDKFSRETFGNSLDKYLLQLAKEG